jgi:hypothetical protein
MMTDFKKRLTDFAMLDDRWDFTGIPQKILNCLPHPREQFRTYGYEPLHVTLNIDAMSDYWNRLRSGFGPDPFWNPRPSTVSKWYVAWNPETGWKWLNYKPCYQQRVMYGTGQTFVHELEHRADLRRASNQLDASWAQAYELGFDRQRMGPP